MRAPLVTASIVFASVAASPATAADFSHVRSAQADVRALLAAGYDRSPTFHRLVDQIDSLPGIVYIERTIALSVKLDGALLLSAAGSPDLPILRIRIRATLGGDYRIANIAHELQHVTEVLGAGATTSDEMARLFASFDQRASHPGSVYETTAAQEVTTQVLKELRGHSGDGTDRHVSTRKLVAVTIGGVATPAKSTLPTVVVFERAPAPYIVIRVPISGQACEAMLFDTGTNTTILDPSLAARVGLTAGRETTVESLVGSARAIAGQVLGIGFDGIPAGTPRTAVAALLTGLRGFGGSIRGLYGHDWLAGTDYLIEYQKKKLVLGPAGTVPKPAGGQRSTLTWASGRPAVTVTIRAPGMEPFTARLVLDSGADTVALFGRAAHRMRLAMDAGRTNTIDSGFGIREVTVSQVRVTIGGRERSLAAQVRGDLTDRDEDGLLPTSLFRSVFVGAAEGVVIFNGDTSMPGLGSQCH